MSKNTKILLNKARSAEAVNVNTTLDFNIKNTNKPLPLNDIDTTLSQYEQFLKERKASTIYRFYGEINCIVSNPLYNENINRYTNGCLKETEANGCEGRLKS